MQGLTERLRITRVILAIRRAQLLEYNAERVFAVRVAECALEAQLATTDVRQRAVVREHQVPAVRYAHEWMGVHDLWLAARLFADVCDREAGLNGVFPKKPRERARESRVG